MELPSVNSGDEPQLPKDFMTSQQCTAANALRDTEGEFLIRAAADVVNRFNEGLTREVPGIEAVPPIHRYVQASPGSTPELYFDASRLAELIGQVREDMRRYGTN